MLADDFWLLSPLQVDFELVLRRPIETAAFIRQWNHLDLDHDLQVGFTIGLGIEVGADEFWAKRIVLDERGGKEREGIAA